LFTHTYPMDPESDEEVTKTQLYMQNLETNGVL
jgi:hypothetical protein